MSTEEMAPTIDALINHLEECLDNRKCVTKNKLDFMRSLAIDVHNQLDRLHTMYAYSERDSRETHKTIKMLEASGLINGEHYSNANSIVTDARGPLNRCTDVDVIKARNIKSLQKGEQL